MSSNFSRLRRTANAQHLQRITTDEPEVEDITYIETSETKNTKISPQEKAEIFELEGVIRNLENSFQEISSIEDPVKREYKILQEAKRLDIPPETYRRMWEFYCSEQEPEPEKHLWLNPLTFLDQRLGDFVKWCENVSLYSLATVIGQFTLLAAMGAYFVEAPQREKEALDNARQEIRNQKGVEYSESRIEAIEYLNKACESLLGEQAPKANLEGVELNKCYKFEWNWGRIAQWPPQFYRYEGFDLSRMDLSGVNLSGANLEGANLEEANLEGANLERANLKGANLKGANLKGAILRAAYLEKANLEEANLDSSRMSRIYLRDANLSKASLINSRLLWADLEGANLNQANFQGSNLSRANLQSADLYKTNFKAALLRYVDMGNETITIGTEFERANLKRAKFWSVDQLKRSYNWDKAAKDKNWEAETIKDTPDKYKIGFIVPNDNLTYKLYQQGLERLAKENKQVEIIPIKTGETVQEEAQGIKQLLTQDVDAIVMRPLDPQKSVPSILQAYVSGVVVVNIGDCLPKEAQKVVFACYESDSSRMGYDLGQYMGNAALDRNRKQVKDLNVGLVDGADSTRLYPYLQGFFQGIKDTNVKWTETGTTDARTPEDVDKVKAMLKRHPNINVLWGGSEMTTEIALQAVRELGLKKKVTVYGIVPLTRKLANMLLDPNQPLQSIVDEAPSYAAEEAGKHAISVIEGKISKEYKHIVFQHRLLTVTDRKKVNDLMGNALDLEKNTLKKLIPLQAGASLIPTSIPSSLDPSIANSLTAITDEKKIQKLQEDLQKLIVQNWQISNNKESKETSVNFDRDLVYRVLVDSEGAIVSYEPIDKLAIDLLQTTPLPKLLSKPDDGKAKDDTLILPTKLVISKSVTEFKVVFSPSGKVELKWGESFLADE
ncbi:substrate-binding domain-containing protein [Anabaena sp. UHCC 0187]|uniref:pentapeptide repeat-containing protein n=1 Tax=Anabaena sp. UHCC 0187 TaxID=2590018 RepID=UPI001446E739|nr:pentapeptide repeat-containing protein [Anabaena sp. UHCC 0187]MDP5017507.1 pentapeptide repeat-containing protein [Dolichospermum sp.]MTJ12141.1 substrate-binding domain-containing protein [Anabaena sp. UHCC 0187]